MTKLPYKFTFKHVDIQDFEYEAEYTNEKYLVSWDHEYEDGSREDGSYEYCQEDVNSFINECDDWIITDVLVENFPKFAVGDKVIVSNAYFGFHPDEIGSIVTIKEVGLNKYPSSDWGYRIEESVGNEKHDFFSGWHGEVSFDKYEAPPYPELKTGMRVIFENVQNRFIYVKDLGQFVGVGCALGESIVSFEEGSLYKISEIYSAPENMVNLFDNSKYGIRVWPELTEQEQKVVELTNKVREMRKDMKKIEEEIKANGGSIYDLYT